MVRLCYKRGIVAALLLFAVGAVVLPQADAADEPNFENAVIRYDLELRRRGDDEKFGDKCRGDKTVYIDNVRNKRREEEMQDCSRAGRRGSLLSTKKESITIYTGEHIYVIYLPDTDVAYRSDILGFFDASVDHESRSAYSMEYIGEERILGRMCQVYEGDSEKVWLWGSLMLKKEDISEKTHFIIEAISIQENQGVDDSLFVLPSDVTDIRKN